MLAIFLCKWLTFFFLLLSNTHAKVPYAQGNNTIKKKGGNYVLILLKWCNSYPIEKAVIQ